MTKKEILAMKAGIELDTLITTEFFPGDYHEYSTEISAAWKVWLKITKDTDYEWAIYQFHSPEELVEVEAYGEDYGGDMEEGCGNFSVISKFPEAICKAALLARLEEK